METDRPNFFKWVFTRWYFWVWLVIWSVTNYQSFESTFAFAGTLIMATAFLTLLFFSYFFAYWKGAERNNLNSGRIKHGK